MLTLTVHIWFFFDEIEKKLWIVFVILNTLKLTGDETMVGGAHWIRHIKKLRWIYIPRFIGCLNRMKSSYYTLYREGESILRLPRSPWDDRRDPPPSLSPFHIVYCGGICCVCPVWLLYMVEWIYNMALIFGLYHLRKREN